MDWMLRQFVNYFEWMLSYCTIRRPTRFSVKPDQYDYSHTNTATVKDNLILPFHKQKGGYFDVDDNFCVLKYM